MIFKEIIDEIKSGKHNVIFYFICFVLLYHLYNNLSFCKNKIENIESMGDVSNDQIAAAVRNYYLSDEFVKNISIVSAQLQRDGLAISGPLKINNTTITEDLLKRILPLQSYAGFAVDGEGTTMLLYEGQHMLYGDQPFNAWTENQWDAIFINRGWRITLWHHNIGNAQAGIGENKSSNVPIRLKIPNDTVSSYQAEWIGY